MNEVNPYLLWLKKTVHVLKDMLSGIPFVEIRHNSIMLRQHEIWHNIIRKHGNTAFGKKYNFSEIHSLKDFQEKVPLCTAEDLLPYFEKLQQGKTNILFKEPLIAWTQNPNNDTDVLFPLTCTMAGKMVSTLHDHYQSVKRVNEKAEHIKKGQGLFITQNEETDEIKGVPAGYLDGILLNLFIKSDNREHNIIPLYENTTQISREERMFEIAKVSIHKDIHFIAGYDGMILNFLTKIGNYFNTGTDKHKITINDIWPNLRCIYAFGDITNNFKHDLQQCVAPSTEILMVYFLHGPGIIGCETKGEQGFLPFFDLNLYEFIPLKEWENSSPEKNHKIKHNTLLFPELKNDSDYVMVITTTGGLYRYVTQAIVRYSSGKLYGNKKHNSSTKNTYKCETIDL